MEEKIYFKDLFKRLFQYKTALTLIMLGSTAFLISLSFLIPKTYRSEFEINIYSKYFKNGIISEVIPGVSSLKEMTDTIDSMIKEIMNDDYIDELGIEFKFYSDLRVFNELTTYSEMNTRARERAFLRDRFKFYSTGAQSYKVQFSGGDPVVTQEVTKKVLDKVKSTFINTRLTTLEWARNSLLKKLESINLTRKITDDKFSANVLASKNPQVLKSELIKIGKNIESLLKQFNHNHPRIRRLESRKQTITNWLSEFKTKDGDDADIAYSEAPLIMSGDTKVASEIASKLYIKYNNINIALEIERKNIDSYIAVTHRPQLPTGAIFPKKRIFASLGFVLGLAICFIYIFYRELMTLRGEDYLLLLSQELNTTYFGHVGARNKDDFLRIEKVQEVMAQQRRESLLNPEKLS